jgi:hypothetical protein
MKLPRRPKGSLATAVLLLLAFLLVTRAHMDLDRTEWRELQASVELPLPAAGIATAVTYRAARTGPHVPGWATCLLPGLFFVALMALSDRKAGRSLATPILLLAGAALLRPSWATGDAFQEALFPLALIPFLPRRGPAAHLAPPLLVLVAALVGEAPHLTAWVLGAEALGVPSRRRALLPAVVLGVALHLALHGPGLPAPAPGWRPPSDLGGWLAVAMALLLVRRGPASERARRLALAFHTVAFCGSLPLLILETLPRLAREVTRRLARTGGRPGQRAALLATAGALLLAPFAPRLGPRNPARGLLLPPLLGPRVRTALRALDPAGHGAIHVPPPYRAEVMALTRLPVTPPLVGPAPEREATARLAVPGAPAKPPPGWQVVIPPGRGPGLMLRGSGSGTVPPGQEGRAHGS